MVSRLHAVLYFLLLNGVLILSPLFYLLCGIALPHLSELQLLFSTGGFTVISTCFWALLKPDGTQCLFLAVEQALVEAFIVYLSGMSLATARSIRVSPISSAVLVSPGVVVVSLSFAGFYLASHLVLHVAIVFISDNGDDLTELGYFGNVSAYLLRLAKGTVYLVWVLFESAFRVGGDLISNVLVYVTLFLGMGPPVDGAELRESSVCAMHYYTICF